MITKKHANNYRECLGVVFGEVDLKAKRILQKYYTNKNHTSFKAEFDIIIIAIGFGLENISVSKYNSYWRNDDLEQPFIEGNNSSKRKIIISGTGDGALVDLLRSTLINFHQGRLIFDFFANCDDIELIKNHINLIKEESKNPKFTHSNWIYNKFDELPLNLLIPLKAYRHEQLRKDTCVILFGRNSSVKSFQSVPPNRMKVYHSMVHFHAIIQK